MDIHSFDVPLVGASKLPSLASTKVRVPETALHAAQAVTFCEIWPAARAVLEVLQKKVPGLAFIVGIVISIGDSVCG